MSKPKPIVVVRSAMDHPGGYVMVAPSAELGGAPARRFRVELRRPDGSLTQVDSRGSVASGSRQHTLFLHGIVAASVPPGTEISIIRELDAPVVSPPVAAATDDLERFLRVAGEAFDEEGNERPEKLAELDAATNRMRTSMVAQMRAELLEARTGDPEVDGMMEDLVNGIAATTDEERKRIGQKMQDRFRRYAPVRTIDDVDFDFEDDTGER